MHMQCGRRRCGYGMASERLRAIMYGMCQYPQSQSGNMYFLKYVSAELDSRIHVCVCSISKSGR